MRIRRAYELLVSAALILLAATSGQAQLARQGTYSGIHAWQVNGTVHQIDTNHLFWTGTFSGPFLNNTGSGFLHGTSWVCPAANDIVNGVSVALLGYCVATDKDGDKAFMAVKENRTPAPGTFEGRYEWTGGTGKYAGLKGKATYRASMIGQTPQGFGHHTGEWQLP